MVARTGGRAGRDGRPPTGPATHSYPREAGVWQGTAPILLCMERSIVLGGPADAASASRIGRDPRFGLDPKIAAEIGPARRWETGGEWAEEVGLETQPGVVEWALTQWDRFAIRGTIEPDAMTVVRCNADGSWSPPKSD